MLNLHVSCNDDNTMNVTSNHLDIMPFPEDQEQQTDPGEELSKRGEYFGHPVGKSEPTVLVRLLLISSAHNYPKTTRTRHPF
jgi:DNA-directed RNA polymerase II subunit RPB3